MTPRRIQRRSVKGWRLPAGAICVTRPGPWGNPIPIDTTREDGRELCVLAYRAALEESVARRLSGPYTLTLNEVTAEPHAVRFARQADDLSELRGHDLACWCKPGFPCHADVLLELANR